MGYSEVPCHLCGLVFNVGRIRTSNESRTSAWSGTADWNDARYPAGSSWVSGTGNVFYGRAGFGSTCSTAMTGCHVVFRGDPNQQGQGAEVSDEHAIETEVDDVEHILGVNEGEEWVPSEEIEDDGSVAEEWESEFEDESIEIHEKEAKGELREVEAEDDSDYMAFIDTFRPKPLDEIKDELLNFPECSEEYKDNLFLGRQLRFYEHIAGPGCKHEAGYHGHRITAEEMRGCKTSQCLVAKDNSWHPESDDLEFERDSRHFLSGISDYMPSRDLDIPSFIPQRHALESPVVDVHNWGRGADLAMPFHPWCLEVFIRLSRQHFGRIDIDGLMNWRNYQNQIGVLGYRNLDQERAAFECIPRDPDLEKCQHQAWYHLPGYEYFAANPVHIPRLPVILLSSKSTSSTGISEGSGAFTLGERDLQSLNSANLDPFARLASELRWAILDHLEPVSIASLRLASRAFRQLPQWIFYRLLRRELPSLWEISPTPDGDPSPYFWTMVNAREIEDYVDNPEGPTDAQKEFFANIELYRKVIKEEMPELYDDWVEAEPSYREYAKQPPWPPAVPDSIRLERGTVNWCRLYSTLMEELRNGGLKGLRNRERIWKDVSFIVDKIAKCREQGHIP